MPSRGQAACWDVLSRRYVELACGARALSELPLALSMRAYLLLFDAYRWIAEMAGVSGTDWALGIQARSAALLAAGEDAERMYRESITRLGRTRLRPDLARAHLLYGEWLRRERRAADAREHLRIAYRMLEPLGTEGFTDRALRELRATGETARMRTTATATATATANGNEELTAQEIQIARLARDGLSNPEIASRLFISARTVQYHLGKVFAKLGIASRGQLRHALP